MVEHVCDPRRCTGDLPRRVFLGKAGGALALAGAAFVVHATDGKILVSAAEQLGEALRAGAKQAPREPRLRGSASTAPSPARPAAVALLEHPRLTLAGRAALDLRTPGLVDARLVSLLGWLLERYRLGIGVFKTGHAMHVRGTRTVSQHWTGGACDIGTVNGAPVSATNRAARRLVADLANLRGALRPSEVGSPFTAYAPLPGFFTDADHRFHIHLGVGR